MPRARHMPSLHALSIHQIYISLVARRSSVSPLAGALLGQSYIVARFFVSTVFLSFHFFASFFLGLLRFFFSFFLFCFSLSFPFPLAFLCFSWHFCFFLLYSLGIFGIFSQDMSTFLISIVHFSLHQFFIHV